MSSYIIGITLVATNDYLLFPFSTDFLIKYPISLILTNIVGYTMYNDVNVIKVDVSSIEIQTYIVLITGFELAPLCHYKEEVTADNTKRITEDFTNVFDIYCKTDELDILDNDEEFYDFDTFLKYEYNTNNN